jgi:hypothetical protein
LKNTHRKVPRIFGAGLALAALSALCALLPTPARADWNGPYAVAQQVTRISSATSVNHLSAAVGAPNPEIDDDVQIIGGVSRGTTDSYFLPQLTAITACKNIVAYWVWDGTGTTPNATEYLSTTLDLGHNTPLDEAEQPELDGPSILDFAHTGHAFSYCHPQYGTLPALFQGRSDGNGHTSPTTGSCWYVCSQPQSASTKETAYFNSVSQSGDCFSQVNILDASVGDSSIDYAPLPVPSLSPAPVPDELQAGNTSTVELEAPDGTIETSATWSASGATSLVSTSTTSGAVTVTRNTTAGDGAVTLTGTYVDGSSVTHTVTYDIWAADLLTLSGVDAGNSPVTAPAILPPNTSGSSAFGVKIVSAEDGTDLDDDTDYYTDVVWALSGDTSKVTSVDNGDGTLTINRNASDTSEGKVTVTGTYTDTATGDTLTQTYQVLLQGTFSINPQDGSGSPIADGYDLYSGDTAYFVSTLDGYAVAGSAYSSWYWGGGGYGTTYHDFNENYQYCNVTRNSTAIPGGGPLLMTVYCDYTSPYTGIVYTTSWDLNLE